VIFRLNAAYVLLQLILRAQNVGIVCIWTIFILLRHYTLSLRHFLHEYEIKKR